MTTPADVDAAWERLGGRPLILEERVAFGREVSMIAVRGVNGDVRCYPLIQNVHRDGVLRESRTPVADGGDLSPQAEAVVRAALDRLDYVGVLAVEFFDRGGRLLVNEMAPRVHNSGHWTIEGARTSQFLNHVRAVIGLPLGETDPVAAAGMVNLLGEWRPAADYLGVPGAALHLYGKSPRAGRKVGHITVLAATASDLTERLDCVRTVLPAGG